MKTGGYGDTHIITAKEKEDACMKRMCDSHASMSMQVGLEDIDTDLQTAILFNRFPRKLTDILSRNYTDPDRYCNHKKTDSEILADNCKIKDEIL